MLSAGTVIAQSSDDGIIPNEPGQIVVWIIIATIILVLYVTIRRSQRRASQAYWDRRKAEEDMRRNDPDLRHDD